MADPYVNFAPAEVGPCTATWFVGLNGESAFNDNPTFGPATTIQPVGTWDFLVDGPLKDVLTTVYANTDAFLEAWATAGGQVDFIAQRADQTALAGATVYGYSNPLNGKGEWHCFCDIGLLPPEALPLRWVVKFSVPHSIIR